MADETDCSAGSLHGPDATVATGRRWGVAASRNPPMDAV